MHEFRSYEEALALSEQDNQVAAPNKQPSGKRPGPKGAHTHAPHEAGNPGSSAQSPSPASPGHTKGIVTKPTGKNKNRLR